MRPGRIRLQALTGETFWFDPGAFCLEFAYTGGEGERSVYETLHSPADLERWIRGAMGVDVERVSRGDLAEAKRVREAIWLTAAALAQGGPVPPEHVRVLNRAAAEPPLVPQIRVGLARAWERPATATQAMSTLARDAVELFTGPMAARIRTCAASDCALMFVDTSRPGHRHWCSMQRCGNRSKVRTFRQRQREEEAR